MADIIDVNIGDQVLEVYWQDEVELNLDMNLMYIKSGQKEIQDYVDNVSKPEINSYIETEAKPIVTEVVNTIAEPLVNEYIETETKPSIDEYVNGLKPSLQNYVNQASNYANNSQTSAKESAASSATALTSANNAKTSETNAKTSETNALSSKNAAASSATESGGYANNAKIWAEGTDAQVQALGGTKSAKGWAEASTNLDYTNITNCITKIPQDIKLELNDGILTLKAGSKVWIPYGTSAPTMSVGQSLNGGTITAISWSENKLFYQVQYNTDKTSARGWTSGEFFVYLAPNGSLQSQLFRLVSSGSTVPGGQSGYRFYNTETNIVSGYDKGVWTDYYSLAIGIATSSDSSYSSLNQVFNGFGYIGSTVFAFPGVKGLIPNGRNADGSLNNTEFTIDTVKIKTMRDDWTQEQEQFIDARGLYGRMIGDHYYDEVNNYNKRNDGTIMPYCSWGSATLTAGRISNFTPKQTFHAVNYYDYAREVDNTVHKTGNEDIYNRKNFIGSGIGIVKSGTAIDIQNKNVDLSVTDGSVYGTSEIHFIDKNGKVQGIFEHQNTTDGRSVAIMAARNHANTGWATVNVGFDANNVAYAVTTTPPANSNGSNIATTAWVRKYGAQLDYSAAITISGTGEKTATASGVLIMTGKGSSAAGSFKITIDGQTFSCYQGYSGSDYNHATFAYFPVGNGQSYTVDELSGSCDLRLIPYK